MLLQLGLDAQFEPVKIIARKSGLQDMTQPSIISDAFQFLDGPTNGKIIDKYVSLFHRPLSNAPKLAKFEISQALHPEPYTCAKYRQNQSQCVSGGPQKK